MVVATKGEFLLPILETTAGVFLKWKNFDYSTMKQQQSVVCAECAPGIIIRRQL